MSFDTINYLLFEKRKPELDNALLEEFNAYMTSRMFSFYDGGKYINYINDTLNTYGSVFKAKEEQFKFYETIIPKLPRKKLNYVKKNKKEKVTEKPPIPDFYSKREIDMFENMSKYPHE
jgi:hypothetical protein